MVQLFCCVGMMCVLCNIKKEREKKKICIHIKDVFSATQIPSSMSS